ncbi:Branched-chain amino acid ABC transporter, amino acid-binding protein [Dissulfuribacter thermophilus]|uniref:Branched-chain amino acid ABC transporter, amino acid-binding protein n=2 Tax=Dissulfuribacter thermophilus TaxID=1156395 RepID=A0A1B9F4T1_9BACT|nr:ABC transporter substrate-binding protein [Dissulfuribacter thermophilus]OCC14938.1 Branched-chain amino acid ABC transporter, amino acid-binding protein [Dissulfuribacter thermophilus]
MMKVSKLFRGLLLFFLLGLFVLPSGAFANRPIKIGSFLALTGPASFLGDPELKTLKMYIEEVNAKGGIDGHKVELIYYDTGGKAKEAKDVVKRLIKKDRVDVIIGGSTSGTTLAVIDIIERARIPFISLAGSIKIIQPVKKWVFKTPHTDRMAAAKIFEDMKKRGITKVALITGDGGFDKSGRAQCLDLAPKYGIQIVADEKYSNSDTDMTTQLTKIRSTDAQAILNFGFGKAPAIVTKNVRQLGIKLPLYQSHGVASRKFIELAGKAADGVRFPAAALLVAEKLPDNDPQKKVLMDYKTKYEAKYGPVSTFGGHAYDGLFIVLEAIDRANSLDKAKIRDEIERTKNFIGTGGIFNMSPTDHLGLDLSAFKMLEVKNGDWILVD